MAITYGFFNSLNGDRVYNADQMSEYFKGLVSNGVYESVGDALQVTAGTGMTVQVGTGRALIDCKWMENDAIATVAISTAHVTLPRYTAVVVNLNTLSRLIEITTIDGTPASTPAKPSIGDNQLCLAYVKVPGAATAVSQANISDQRGQAACPWVTGLIKQVDTSQLFLQWQTAFEDYYDAMTAQFDTWFSELTSSLNVSTYIKQYRKDAVLSSTNVVPLDMDLYVYNASDIIMVFINGLLAVENTDYTLTVSDGDASVATTATAEGTVVTIITLKSRVGFAVIGTSGGAILSTSSNQELAI